MRFFIFFIIFLCSLGGCINNNIHIIDYKYKRKKNKPIFYMSIPNNYEVSYLSGDHEYVQQYSYDDSALLYITTFDNTPNYEQIRKQGQYYERFNAILNYDTLCISGIDSLGRHWKDSLLSNGITLGYSKVPKERKLEFDKAISSFRSKRKDK